MANNIYSIVEKPKTRSFPKKENAEFIVGEFISPLYEAVEAETNYIQEDNPGYSMLMRDEESVATGGSNSEYSALKKTLAPEVTDSPNTVYSALTRDTKRLDPVDSEYSALKKTLAPEVTDGPNTAYSALTRDTKRLDPADSEYSALKKTLAPEVTDGPNTAYSALTRDAKRLDPVNSEYSELKKVNKRSIPAEVNNGPNSVLSGNKMLVPPNPEYSVLTKRSETIVTRANTSNPRFMPADTTNKNAGKHDKSGDLSCKRFICILVTITLVTIISLVCLAVLAFLFLEVIKLKNQLASVQNQQMQNDSKPIDQNLLNTQNIQQLNTSIDMILQQLSILHSQTTNSNTMLQQQLSALHNQTQTLSDSNTMLQQQLTTLHNRTQSDSDILLHQQLHNQIEQLSNDTELLKNNLVGQIPLYPTTSCAALPPSYPSGYYWVRASNGSGVSVYCDMTLSCGGVTGGWVRVLELDMTNSRHQCPSALMERNDSPNIRTCVRNEFLGGCSTVELSKANIKYFTVCGRITAYQFGQVDNFVSTDINSAYVDGVSLTRGSPRQHIWTFAAANDGNSICDCRDRATSPRPESVGEDFFCDTGNLSSSRDHIFYADNRLWDGDGCSTGNTCCSNNNPPYFNKTLSGPTTDNIEMRVCRDEGASNEDIAIESVEIYIQ